MNVLPLAGRWTVCARCNERVLHFRGFTLAHTPVHGLTERFDANGAVIGYVHLPIWPAHCCPESANL